MSHFAKINNDNIVTEIIVSEQDFINSGTIGDSFRWVQCSYNNNFRKKFAGIGDTYNISKNYFIIPKPYDNWTLDETTYEWTAPVTYPDDGKTYYWDEDTTNWKETS